MGAIGLMVIVLMLPVLAIVAMVSYSVFWVMCFGATWKELKDVKKAIKEKNWQDLVLCFCFMIITGCFAFVGVWNLLRFAGVPV